MLYCPNFFWNVLQVWMTGKDVYLQMTWSWPDKTWNILCSYCLQWNTSQSKFRNHYFLFLFAFSILSQLFLIWGCIFLHKYDPKHNQIFIYVLRVDKEKQIKQVREKYFLCHLFIEKSDPVLHICALQMYVNLCFQYLVWPPFAAVAEGKVSCKCWSVLHNNM